MTAAEDPGVPGRRANGLQAADWGALVDLDPRLSEGLLARLAEAGVAAYVEPASTVDRLHRAVVMPGRPLDRLWVDPARADSAREVVAAEVADLTALLAEDDPSADAGGLVQPVPRTAAPRVLPPPALPTARTGPRETPRRRPGDDARRAEEEAFARLVADFHRDAGERSWPDAEDLPRPAAAPDPAPADPSPAPPGSGALGPPRRRHTDPPPEPPPAVEPLPSWVEPDALEDDGHYSPPTPPPVPRVRLRTAASVAAIVLGLLVLFAPGVLGLAATREVGVLGLALLAGGAGALVWWMRDGASDDGPDDGAVV